MWIIAGILLVGAIILALNWAANAPPRAVMKSGLWAVGILAGAVLLVLVLTGRLGFLWAAALAVIPWINRVRMARTIYNFFKTMRGPSPGQNSEIKTRFLAMTLDHDSGALDGLVREGAFAGRRLSAMELPELLDLAGEVASHDSDSWRLLETYMDRRFGSDWRQDFNGADGPGTGEGTRSGASNGPMSRDEAYDILGLSPGAGKDEIKAAHRRLMKTAHPDRGGSDYLAAKINQAKDVLLA